MEAANPRKIDWDSLRKRFVRSASRFIARNRGKADKGWPLKVKSR
jgi:hypothetical protein